MAITAILYWSKLNAAATPRSHSKFKSQIYFQRPQNSGQKINKIESAMERDNFLTPKEAQSFGLIDEVVEKRPVETGE